MLCDLSCRILRNRKRARAQILDVSDSGLCLLSPVKLNQGDDLRIEFEVPQYGLSKIQAFVWHVRSIKNSSTQKLNWTAGMVLVKSDDTYARLLASTDPNASVEGDPNDKSDAIHSFRVRVQMREELRSRLLTLGAATENEAREEALSDEIQVFRVRVQIKGEQRTRLLTLGAATEEEARKLALADLDDSWTILQVQNSSAAV
jgi:hypothetical protein